LQAELGAARGRSGQQPLPARPWVAIQRRHAASSACVDNPHQASRGLPARHASYPDWVNETSTETLTPQLVLRSPRLEDEAAYLALFRRREVEAWLRPAPLAAFEAAELRQMLHDDIEHWERNGFGPWALFEKASGEFAGRAGLRWTAVEGEAAVELAWTIEPAWQGRGLATEAARAGLELGGARGIERVVALVLAENAASRRVAEKLGMQRDGEVEHAGLPHLVYRLSLIRVRP
jgi:[ribosomal protein S5]-alanine N-acetyltransferase